MKRRRHDALRAQAAQLALRAFAALPLPVAQALGAFWGAACARLPTELRRVSRINLALCYPELNDERREALVRNSLRETGKALAELGALWLWDPQRVLRLIRRVEGGELVTSAIQAGKGAILVTPHLGAWELAGLYCAAQNAMTTLYRPPRLDLLDELTRAARARTGAELVPTTARGVRAVYRALAEGKFVGILPDQDPGSGAGVFAPFFSIPANTMTLLPRLAHKTGAPVIFIHAERLPRGQGYVLYFSAAPEAIADSDSRRAAQALNATVERLVRELPGQYLWSYKRFKTRPAGEASLY